MLLVLFLEEEKQESNDPMSGRGVDRVGDGMEYKVYLVGFGGFCGCDWRGGILRNKDGDDAFEKTFEPRLW